MSIASRATLRASRLASLLLPLVANGNGPGPSQAQLPGPSAVPGRENPDKSGTRGPILEIDHVHDLALEGPDHPAQMIALCPNCHAVKTRGRSREELRPILLEAARKKHDEWAG